MSRRVKVICRGAILAAILGAVPVLAFCATRLVRNAVGDHAHDSIQGVVNKVADAPTYDNYHDILGLADDGGRYAGRVWTDKSVLTGDFSEEMENNQTIVVQNDSDFLTAFSALGSSRMVNHSVANPVDMIFVIDISTSMANYNYVAEAMAAAGRPGEGFPSPEYQGVLSWEETRLEKTLQAIEQASRRIHYINPDSRTAIVAYGRSAAVLLPLDNYEEVRLTSQDLGWASAWFHFFSVSAEGKQGDTWSTPITIANESAHLTSSSEASAADWEPNSNVNYRPAYGSQEAEAGIPNNYFTKAEASKYLEGFKNDPSKPYYTDSNYYTDAVTGYDDYDYKLIGSTNFDAGLYVAMQTLADASDTTLTTGGETVNRLPAIIAMTDGNANCVTVGNNWYEPGVNGTYRNTQYRGDNYLYTASTSRNTPAVTNQDTELSTFPFIAAKTIMSAAYMKQKVINHYSTADNTAKFGIYTVGYDLGDANQHLLSILDPATYFHDGYTDSATSIVNDAYAIWRNWSSGQAAQANLRNSLFYSGGFLPANYTFAQLPSSTGVTREDMQRNINYVDHYYHADTENGSQQPIDAIFEEAVTDFVGTAFHPVSDNITSQTSVRYRDEIGEYMEVKEMKKLLLFGKAYPIHEVSSTSQADGSTVTEYKAVTEDGQDAEIINQGYNHRPVFRLSEIAITVTTDTDGRQVLEIGLPQNALPIRTESVQTELQLVGDGGDTYQEVVNSYQSNQYADTAKPLRVLYTIGTQDAIKGDNGAVDLAQISEEYKAKHLTTDAQGKPLLNLYSNVYNDGTTRASQNRNDVMIHFTPSLVNRFYYFQKNRTIYAAATGLDVEGEGTLQSYGGTADVSQPITNLADIHDGQSYYLVIDFYRPTATAGEYVEYVVTRSGEDLHNALTYYNPVTGGTSETSAAAAGGNLADVVVATKIGGRRLGRLLHFVQPKVQNVTGTADYAYFPSYHDEHGTADIAVQLGNNGRLTLTDNQTETPDQPDQPDQPDDPDDPNNPDNPNNPDKPGETEKPGDETGGGDENGPDAVGPLGVSTENGGEAPKSGTASAAEQQSDARAEDGWLIAGILVVVVVGTGVHLWKKFR